MANMVSKLEHGFGWPVQVTAAAAMVSGEIVSVAGRAGIVMGMGQTYAIGDEAVVETAGIVRGDAVSEDTWIDGAPVYWDTTAENITDTVSTNIYLGTSIGAKVDAQVKISVILNGKPGDAA